MKIACVQCNVAFNDPLANAQYAVEQMRKLRAQDVDLVVFPEAFLTGYCVETLELAREIAIPLDHVAIAMIVAASSETGLHVVFGFAAAESSTLSNAAMLIEPSGVRHIYRKTHLPELGYDKFVRAGDELPVFDTSLGRIGIAICFDLRPPEVIRILALRGAELIVLPTNWPDGADFAPDQMAGVRANENRVFLVGCNRTGTENGFHFIGKSGIWDITGKRVAEAYSEETVLIADVDLSRAREKRVRIIPDHYETTIFESRRPEIYCELTRSS